MIYDANDIADAIDFYTTIGQIICANDVWHWLGHDAVLKHPNGTMGAGFQVAVKRGIIVFDGYTRSIHGPRKGGLIRTWRVVFAGTLAGT